MNKEEYLEFMKLQEKTEKLREDAESRVEEIFRCSFDRNTGGIDSIEFGEKFVDVHYTIYGRFGSTWYEDMHLPSEFIYENDWKEKYSIWAEREKQKARQEELRVKNEKRERERKERHELYQTLKKEFEG